MCVCVCVCARARTCLYMCIHVCEHKHMCKCVSVTFGACCLNPEHSLGLCVCIRHGTGQK